MKRLILIFLGCCVASAPAAEGPPMLTNLWTFDIRVPSDASPALGPDGTIYLGNFRGHFFAISPEGQKRWEFRARREIKSSAAVADNGQVYFGSRDRNLYCLSSSGKKLWAFPTGGWVDASPALGADGTVYVGSWDKRFYALGQEGKKRWVFQAGGPIDSSAAIASDSSLRFGCQDGKLYALDSEGKLRWSFDAGSPIVSSPALGSDDTAYFTTVKGVLFAVGRDGKARWKLQTGGITRSSPAVGPDGMIYVGVNKLIWAVTPEGTKKWERVITGDAYQRETDSTPVVLADNSLLVISKYGLLLPIAAGGVHSKWFYFVGEHGGCSPAVAADGTIYDAGLSRYLHAVKTTERLAQASWPKFRGNPQNTGAR
jgi:outer membrane protein assembly factor BamB